MHYKASLKTPLSLSRVSARVSILSLLSDSEKQWTSWFDLPWKILTTNHAWTWCLRIRLCCRRPATCIESVFLASYGGARRPVPPSLLPTLWKIALLICPRSWARGKWGASPRRRRASTLASGASQPRRRWPEEDFIINKKTQLAGDRDMRKSVSWCIS